MTTTAVFMRPIARPGRDAADALADRLVEEMRRRWGAGDRPLAEEYFNRHPELWEHGEAASELIYEEVCLRREFGMPIPVREILDRFPQWRSQLALMLDCQQLLDPRHGAPQFPVAGDSLGDFLLVAELGRGAQGVAFLARQRSLGDRTVVLKFTPYDATEHLSLARLQHTNIVPLYSVQDYPERNLRTLCMPFFGGVTLERLLDDLRPIPPWSRVGQHLLDVLDHAQLDSPVLGEPDRPGRAVFARDGYAESICRIGICLADAMQYAHERGLVHLDLKPSNVLIAADGQPMVLDFHLARGPLHEGNAAPAWFGGTPDYMSPEQEAAFTAARQSRPIPQAVNERADIYSLGAVLYEALGASSRKSLRRPLALEKLNPRASPGLVDIIHKCMASEARRRYPNMAALGADLRRHLLHLPLQGIRNRSWAERWCKWRRRRPHGVALTAMMIFVATATSAVAVGAAKHVADRMDHAEAALAQAHEQMVRQDWHAAANSLRRGMEAMRGLPGRWSVTDELERRLNAAIEGLKADERTAAARSLHTLADRVRALYGVECLAEPARTELAASCSAFWRERQRIVQRFGPALAPAIREDLLEAAIFLANLLDRRNQEGDGRTQALAVLADAESLFGANPVLTEEKRWHGSANEPATIEPAEASTAWPHYALARARLRSGKLDLAAEEANRAVRIDPRGFWPNFYHGHCAFRQRRYAEAAAAFGVCIGAVPNAAGCFLNRGLAFAALGLAKPALGDYSTALRLDPTLTVATLGHAATLRLIPFLNSDRQPSNSAPASGIHPR